MQLTAQKALRLPAFLNSDGTCSANIWQRVIGFHRHREPSNSTFYVPISKQGYGDRPVSHNRSSFLDTLQNGFCKDANGDLVPHTTDDLPAPKAIIEMVNCHCKGNCSSQRCGCRSHNLACTELCLCSTECQNDDDYNCNPLSDESTN